MSLALAQIDLPIRLRPAAAMTDGEFERFCAANWPMRFERDGSGEILVMSPTGSETSSQNSYLTYQVAKWAEETGSGKTFDSNGGFTLPDGSVRAADVAWTSSARWNGLSEAGRQGFARVCPEFVIELRSPSDRLVDLQEKMEMWLANGVEVGWLIDPEGRTVTIYRPGQVAERMVDPGSVPGDGPVSSFCLAMARVWG